MVLAGLSSTLTMSLWTANVAKPAAGRFGADYTLEDKDKNKPEEAESVQDSTARSAST
jgi:hypothetical protein